MIKVFCSVLAYSISFDLAEELQAVYSVLKQVLNPNWLPIHAKSASETNIYKMNDKTQGRDLSEARNAVDVLLQQAISM